MTRSASEASTGDKFAQHTAEHGRLLAQLLASKCPDDPCLLPVITVDGHPLSPYAIANAATSFWWEGGHASSATLLDADGRPSALWRDSVARGIFDTLLGLDAARLGVSVSEEHVEAVAKEQVARYEQAAPQLRAEMVQLAGGQSISTNVNDPFLLGLYRDALTRRAMVTRITSQSGNDDAALRAWFGEALAHHDVGALGGEAPSPGELMARI